MLPKIVATDALIIFDNSRGLKQPISIASSLFDGRVNYSGHITRLKQKISINDIFLAHNICKSQ